MKAKHRVIKKTAELGLVGAVAFGCGYAGTKAGTSTENTASGGSTVTTVSYTSSSGELSGTEVAATISPSVVSIMTEEVQMSYSWYGSQVVSGAGSGIILSEDGYIITCAHVVDGADTITVTTYDGIEYEAEVVGSDTEDDIAVLKIDAEGLTPATIGDSSSVETGETVYAAGNPGGTLSGTITDGIVSAVNREITVSLDSGETITLNVIQTNAAVSPGSSGGGLFDSTGALIGIVNAKSSGEDQEGLGFAIPINTAMEIATDIIENGAYSVSSSETTQNVSENMPSQSQTQTGRTPGMMNNSPQQGF